MVKRIAFVANSLSGLEISGVIRDATKIFNMLTDPDLGGCSITSPKPYLDCPNYYEFQKEFRQLLRNFSKDDQLIFYFSGHGKIINDEFVVQIGKDKNELLIFGNLLKELKVWNVHKAIIMIDACHSGAALGEKNNLFSLNSLDSLTLPNGIALIASSREIEKSYVFPDGSGSVFTRLLCDGIESGLNNNPTVNGVITIGQIVEYINERFKEPEFEKYFQKCEYKVFGADSDIWIAKNKSGQIKKEVQLPNISNQKRIRSEGELRILYERTLRARHPCFGSTIEEIDWDLIDEFAKKELNIENIEREDTELLKKLKLFSPINEEDLILHNAAVLCFCKNPNKHLPSAESIFTFGNTDETRFLRKEIQGPLSKQIDALVSLCLKYLDKISVINGTSRKEEYDVPEDLLREIISNAIAHRDYSHNSSVQIRLTSKFLEVQSPGNFPENITWNHLIKMQLGSNPIDPVLSYYLVKLDKIEKVGRGFDIIKKYLNIFGGEFIKCDVQPGPSILLRIKRGMSERTRIVTPIQKPKVEKKPIFRYDTVINITPQASIEGLKEMLERESDKKGVSFRHFCGGILKKIINAKDEYNKPLKKPLPKGGKAINISLDENVKKELKDWAKNKNTPLGKHCAFLLEKWLEINNISREM